MISSGTRNTASQPYDEIASERNSITRVGHGSACPAPSNSILSRGTSSVSSRIAEAMPRHMTRIGYAIAAWTSDLSASSFS